MQLQEAGLRFQRKAHCRVVCQGRLTHTGHAGLAQMARATPAQETQIGMPAERPVGGARARPGAGAGPRCPIGDCSQGDGGLWNWAWPGHGALRGL